MALSPDTQETRRFWVTRFGWTIPLLCGAMVGVDLRLFFSGTPGEPYHAAMSSFTLLVPILVGTVTVYIAERAGRRSWSYYFFAATAKTRAAPRRTAQDCAAVEYHYLRVGAA